MVPSRT